MRRINRGNREPGEGDTGGRGRGSPIGPLVELIVNRHPSFSTSPLGDWKELVGEQVARYCQPRSLKEKVLVIGAYDPVWKHHLELHKSALMEKINRDRPEPVVERIVVRVEELLESPPPLNPRGRGEAKSRTGTPQRMKKKKTPTRPLNPEEKKLLKGLPDAELRTLGARLLKRIPESSE